MASRKDEEDENPATYLRRLDAVLQMPRRVPALHVCLFTELGRGLDHGRSARTIYAATGKIDRTESPRPSAYKPEPRIAFYRRRAFFKCKTAAQGRSNSINTKHPVYLCRNQLFLVQNRHTDQRPPTDPQPQRIKRDHDLGESVLYRICPLRMKRPLHPGQPAGSRTQM